MKSPRSERAVIMRCRILEKCSFPTSVDASLSWFPNAKYTRRINNVLLNLDLFRAKVISKHFHFIIRSFRFKKFTFQLFSIYTKTWTKSLKTQVSQFVQSGVVWILCFRATF